MYHYWRVKKWKADGITKTTAKTTDDAKPNDPTAGDFFTLSWAPLIKAYTSSSERFFSNPSLVNLQIPLMHCQLTLL